MSDEPIQWRKMPISKDVMDSLLSHYKTEDHLSVIAAGVHLLHMIAQLEQRGYVLLAGTPDDKGGVT